VASSPWRQEAISRWSCWRVGFIAAGLRYTRCGRGRYYLRRGMVAKLLQTGESFFGVFSFFAVGVEFEIGLVFGDGFVFFLHLLRDLGQREVGGGVFGLDGDGIFGAEVGAGVVVVAHIKLCDVKVFVYALIVGLDPLDLGKFAMNGGAFRRIAFCG
jgi:hypothetical protein